MKSALTRAIGQSILAVAFALAAVPPPEASAQSDEASLRVQENFRAEPNGLVIGVLEPGTHVRVVSRRGDWLEVETEGWIWIRSLQVTGEAGMDLVVSREGGENLRADPSGAILGRFGEGTLLEERERIPGWIRIRRRGWLWAASTTAAATGQPSDRSAAAGPAASPGGATPNASARGAPQRRSASLHRADVYGAAILTSPDGDTLAIAAGGAELPVVAREGNWARVRLEGWVWMPPPAEGAGAVEASKASPAEVAADPDAYRGRLVSWTLQFISRERAEEVRTDFYEGEPFLLMRHQDGLFVYVAVPPERLVDVEGLIPLERISVVGRVRVTSSELTGSPILDLVELRRAGGR